MTRFSRLLAGGLFVLALPFCAKAGAYEAQRSPLAVIAERLTVMREYQLETFAMLIPLYREAIGMYCSSAPRLSPARCQELQATLALDIQSHATMCIDLAIPKGKYDCK